jgi:hypothetical protein
MKPDYSLTFPRLNIMEWKKAAYESRLHVESGEFHRLVLEFNGAFNHHDVAGMMHPISRTAS